MIDIKPPIKLDHLKALTDDTGILQHTKYSIPNRKEGYTTDDNARALGACIKFLQFHDDSDVSKLANTYLSFLFHMQRHDGKFHNLLVMIVASLMTWGQKTVWDDLSGPVDMLS